MRLPLKDFQIESLDQLKQYAKAVREYKLTGSRSPERDALEEVTAGRQYYQTPNFAGVPYVCLRLPTGGGKTLLAAHAVGVVGRSLLETDQPACLWITPSTTIRDQTLRALKNSNHPYRIALEEALGAGVEVSTIEEVLLSPRHVKAAAPLVVGDDDPVVPRAGRQRAGACCHAPHLPRQRLHASSPGGFAVVGSG